MLTTPGNKKHIGKAKISGFPMCVLSLIFNFLRFGRLGGSVLEYPELAKDIVCNNNHELAYKLSCNKKKSCLPACNSTEQPDYGILQKQGEDSCSNKLGKLSEEAVDTAGLAVEDEELVNDEGKYYTYYPVNVIREDLAPSDSNNILCECPEQTHAEKEGYSSPEQIINSFPMLPVYLK